MSRRKQDQGFSNWTDFGTRAHWQEIQNSPNLTGEIVLQRLVFVFGLKNPLEKFSSKLTAGIMTAQYGASAAAWITEDDMDKCFEWVKARPCMHALPVFSPLAFAVTTVTAIYWVIHTCVRGHNRESSILDDACLCDMFVRRA